MAVADPPRAVSTLGNHHGKGVGLPGSHRVQMPGNIDRPVQGRGQAREVQGLRGLLIPIRSITPESGSSGHIDAATAVASTQDTKERRGMPGGGLNGDRRGCDQAGPIVLLDDPRKMRL